MQHLDTDRLAALADEPPTEVEASHLASCVVCRRERDAFVALLALAREEGNAAIRVDAAVGEPLTSWESLSGALRAEGLARPSIAGANSAHAETVVRTLPASPAAAFWRRAAASIALLAGGGAIGRFTAPQAVAATNPSATPAAQMAVTPPPVAPAPAASAVPAPTQVASRRETPAATVASRGLSDTLSIYGEPNGVSDALAVLTRAQRDYQRAASYLAEHDTSMAGSPQALRARLAAVDEVNSTVRKALTQAPQDPVLNNLYFNTADVRETTLRQLGRVLPANTRLSAY